MFSLSIVIVAVATITAVSWWQNRHKRKLYNELKCDWKCWPILGHSWYFIGSGEEMMNSLAKIGESAIKSGGSICVWILNQLVYLTTEAEDGAFILTACLEKDDCLKVTHCIGINLIFAPLKLWRARRKIIAPLFSVKRLLASARVHLKHALVLENQLKSVAGKNFSIWDYISAYSMDSIGETILGTQLDVNKTKKHPFLNAFVVNTEVSGTRILQPWLQNEFIFRFSSLYFKMVDTSRLLKDFVQHHVLEKTEILKNNKSIDKYYDPRDKGTEPLMEKFIKLCDENIGFTPVDVRNETLGLFLAALDTTNVTVISMLWLLSRHPEKQEKLFRELKEYFGDTENTVVASDFQSLKYLDAVLKETLRLYPPVPIIVRKITEPLNLPSGRKLLPGMGAYIHVRSIQRNPKYWGADAEDFRPERFLEDYDNSAFMPFGRGARLCLGFQYANMSLKSALVHILRRYRCKVPPGSSETLRLKFGVTAKPVEENLVHLEVRT